MYIGFYHIFTKPNVLLMHFVGFFRFFFWVFFILIISPFCNNQPKLRISTEYICIYTYEEVAWCNECVWRLLYLCMQFKSINTAFYPSCSFFSALFFHFISFILLFFQGIDWEEEEGLPLMVSPKIGLARLFIMQWSNAALRELHTRLQSDLVNAFVRYTMGG